MGNESKLTNFSELDKVKEALESQQSMVETVDAIVSKQLEHYDVDANPSLNREEWIFSIETTPEEKDRWLEWGVRYIQKNHNKDRVSAEVLMSWVDLNYGLKIKGGFDAIKSHLVRKGVKVL